MNVLPTSYKQKLPRGWSYPIGAEVLSSHLLGIPQFADLRVHFSRHNLFFASRHESNRRAGRPYVILAAYFRRPENSPAAPRKPTIPWWTIRWELVVYAVPSALKSAAHSLLVETAMPRLREWFLTLSREPQLHSSRAIRMLFSEAEITLSVQ